MKKFIPTFETFISNTTVGNGIEINYQTGPNWRMLLGTSSRKLKICMYFDQGVTSQTVDAWELFFTRNFNMGPQILSADDMHFSRLKNFDLLVIPGGSSFEESLGLGENHKSEIRKYVEQGGKLLAVCAGAHLVSSGHEWSMNLVPIYHIDRQEDLSQDIFYLHFDITPRGQEVFNTELDSVRLYFHGGPIFYMKKPEKGVDVLLEFDDEVPAVNPDIKDFTSGRIAAILSEYGKGKILTISPHIEKSHPEDDILANAINYLVEKRWFNVF